MELFDVKGCLSEEGLQALVGGQLDETQRLEAAEHLAYCDRCMDRYTALLTDDVLEQPPRSARGAVMGTIWIRLMQNTWGRAAVATVAAVLALTLWRAGTLEQILHTGQQLNTWLPQTTQQTEPELLGKPVNDKAPQQSTAPLGKPIEDKKQLTEKLSDALDALLHHSAEAGAFAHHHVLPVYYPRQHHGAGRTGSRLYRCVYVQLFRYLEPPRAAGGRKGPGGRLSGAL